MNALRNTFSYMRLQLSDHDMNNDIAMLSARDSVLTAGGIGASFNVQAWADGRAGVC